MALDGTVSSIAVKGNRLYGATTRKCIQVVDLDQVMSEFQGATNVAINYQTLFSRWNARVLRTAFRGEERRATIET